MSKLDDADKEVISSSDIASWFSVNAGRYDNMRTMKSKISKAIFEMLSEQIVKGGKDA